MDLGFSSFYGIISSRCFREGSEGAKKLVVKRKMWGNWGVRRGVQMIGGWGGLKKLKKKKTGETRGVQGGVKNLPVNKHKQMSLN